MRICLFGAGNTDTNSESYIHSNRWSCRKPKARKGARINVEGAILTTDENGKAEFNLRSGTYTAKISLKGCVSVTETVIVEKAAVNKTITLATQS